MQADTGRQEKWRSFCVGQVETQGCRSRPIALFYLNTALDGVNGQDNIKTDLPLRKYAVPIITEAVWALDPALMLWTRGKSIFLVGNQTLIIQRVTQSWYQLVSRILSETDPRKSRPKRDTQNGRNKFPIDEVYFKNVCLLVLLQPIFSSSDDWFLPQLAMLFQPQKLNVWRNKVKDLWK
jgi:hypothetical protein